MKKVSNPLTIVAIFVGLAEIAGTTVLPFVTPELQKIFIWYVMGLPILLVILFFITWNFNSKVLYSPNDFSDERNYMESLKMFHQIKETVDTGRKQGETDNKIIEKVYNSVSNEIQRRDGIESRITQLLAKNPEGMGVIEISEKMKDYSIPLLRRKIMQLQAMEIVDYDYKRVKSENGETRIVRAYKLKEGA